MEQRLSKLTKKRRRWLIGAFVLVFVSVCSWWYWPRGDARLVGKWSVYFDRDIRLATPEQPAEPFGLATFHRRGIMCFLQPQSDESEVLSWCVRDNCLILGFSNQGRSGRLMALARRAANDVLGTDFRLDGTFCRIHEISDDAITLGGEQPLSGPTIQSLPLVYRRIPE